MRVNLITASTGKRIHRLLEAIKTNYGFDISRASASQLQQLGNKYAEVKARIVAESAFNTYTSDPQYAKAVLITEAVKLLIEIAPKRRKKSIKESTKGEEKMTYKKGDRVLYKGKECDVVKFILAGKDADPTNDILGINHEGKIKRVSIKDVKPCKTVKESQLNESAGMDPYEYQASMARSELYRNTKYAMAMMHMIRAEDEVQPWIAASLTKAANYLDKIYHYLDYYTHFEPQQLPEDMDMDAELGETSGSIARQNLLMIVEYSTKLFEMISPGDQLEGWVAMKLTTASDCISSSKHYMEYAHFEKHGLDDHFDEGRRANRREVAESMAIFEDEDLEHAQTLLAAKDISDRLQKMAEEAAKMAVDDLMPLVDVMKSQFGLEQANAFNEVVKEKLQTVLDSVMAAKDQTDNAILTLQGGGTPSAPSDIEQPEAAPVAPEAGSAPEAPADGEEDFEKEFDATPATSGPATEPLGRARKDELAEAKKGKIPPQFLSNINKMKAKAGKKKVEEKSMECKECDEGTYMEDSKGKMKCDECGHTMIAIAEAWDVDMETKPKDVGKWEGWTQAELRARKAKLMKKEERTAAETKEVRQINFALRAKHGFGKVDEDVIGAPSAPTAPGAAPAKPMAKDLSTQQLQDLQANKPIKDETGKPITGISAQDAKNAMDSRANLHEKAVSKAQQQAAGIALAAKKGEIPKKDLKGASKAMAKMSTKELEKFAGTKHKGLPEKVDEQVKQLNHVIEGLDQKYGNLVDQFTTHLRLFGLQLNEGKQIDPLNLGYGLEGEAIVAKLNQLNSAILEVTATKKDLLNKKRDTEASMTETQAKILKLDEQLATQPWGVVGVNSEGKRVKKFFENQDARTMWMNYNSTTIKEAKMIGPDTIAKARAVLAKKVK